MSSVNIDNAIHDEGCITILRALSTSKLSTIELSNNGLTDKSAIAFGRILSANVSSLVSVSLEGNEVTSIGAKALANSLEVSKTLKGLNLNCTRKKKLCLILSLDHYYYFFVVV